MQLYTSYFSHCSYGPKTVAICRRVPDWYTGRRCMLLAPSYELLWNYKNGWVTEDEYREEYLNYLDSIGIDRALSELKDGDILLCWEGKGKFCHRHILASWLMKHGHIVTELQ